MRDLQKKINYNHVLEYVIEKINTITRRSTPYPSERAMNS